ncbi:MULTISPECIES: hypothetical protein [Hymenobacter]|uniref:Uncharacterized protein n=1 Tax=Hymenobacter mucosus TaxID=1411120 RepID=A0A238WD61_9BACT|nr:MULTISPECIES: hypothetical protein [Hymenobacter]SNR44408.1 hypothetical protein SAMN06269173_102484 [Hymenobacter mucosus]
MSSDSSFSLTPRPDLGVLIARWAEDAPTPQLQRHYAALLAAAQQHGLWRWLLDVRRRDQLDPEFGWWSTHIFYPEVAHVAVPPFRIAVHCSPVRLAIYESDSVQQQYIRYGTSEERAYQLRLFIEEGPAMEWLLS